MKKKKLKQTNANFPVILWQKRTFGRDVCRFYRCLAITKIFWVLKLKSNPVGKLLTKS